ncbi:GNAT family N-acetyltransferase [Segeticoccus rhizosphaerae]|jgi:predicted GNAT family acetyltransferase|uniref:GNAT family N-acetyltransferase n=1 Tax=Segeticoccus rhizosphaerae TaxID=1104777 RepID=UPI0010C0D5B6|nr:MULTISPECIES: GNAT family N-acetyltransferase [Intrasporangiaceae]
MLRTHSPVRALTVADRDEALAVCATDPAANVFVSARILEGALGSHQGELLGFADGGGLRSLCWVSANVVPVAVDEESLSAFTGRLRRRRRECSSLFGPAEAVLPLWQRLSRYWGRAIAVRDDQPMLSIDRHPRDLGVPLDRLVRRARAEEVDAVVPAAAAMFTEEIGYPPYSGSDAPYRAGVSSLIARGHTFVRTEDGRVIFKADVGSVGQGVAQIQGVWVAPSHRGRGLAVPAMAAVVQQVQDEIAREVTLYVNNYNAAARATYRRVGFVHKGRFATVLL